MGGFLLNWRQLNPNGFHLLQYMQDDAIRFIVLYGGSSSGKSYSVAQVTLLMTLSDKQNSLVLRKVGASIQKTIYEDFRSACRQLGMERFFVFRINCIKCANGARIDFSGLDDPEKIKGIANYKRVLMEELSEFDIVDFKQIRKRLRGKKGQQVVATFNPIQETHWIKQEWLDKQKWHDVSQDVHLPYDDVPSELTTVKSIKMNEAKRILNPRTGEYEDHAPDTVVVQSTYLNNFWVVGSPDGEYGFYDSQCIADFENDRINDPDYYQVYALGEWGVIRTGGEFFGSFSITKHTERIKHNPDYPIHISVDNNVLPYISISFWQVITDCGNTKIVQFDELAAKPPNNTVRRAARLVAQQVQKYNATEVYLHGDASTRAANTFDEEKRSWLDLFIASMENRGIKVNDCVGTKNPPVALTGEFINAIFDEQVQNTRITINNLCSVSIEDYQAVQKDANGAILKTRVKDKLSGQTYEAHGHLSDTFRYVCIDVLKDKFIAFANRRKRNIYAKDGAVQFFNPATEYDYERSVCYFNPNLNGKFILVQGARTGEGWNIIGVRYFDTASTDTITNTISSLDGDMFVCECTDAYFAFVRELRRTAAKSIRVVRYDNDIDRRISATSDYVRNHIKFNDAKIGDDEEYSAFVTDMLDYNKNSENYESASVMSGFAKFVAKLI